MRCHYIGPHRSNLDRYAPLQASSAFGHRRGGGLLPPGTATNTVGGRLAELERRHRLRARAEDRIRALKDTGLTNLPLQVFAKDQIWLELACLAYELLTWTQLLAWPNQPARAWEPKRLRLRKLTVAARLITTGRRHILRLPKRWPWSDLITSGHHRLVAFT